MQLEKIATPQEEATPELRYASLHRAVERGMASDEVLAELVDICLRLGHFDEAVRVHAGMKASPTKEHVAARLARQGLLDRKPGAKPLALPAAAADDDAMPSLHEHAVDSIQYLTQGYMPAIALATMLAFPVVVGVGGMLTSGASPWAFAALAAPPGLCVLGIVGAMARQVFLKSSDGEEEVPEIPAPPRMAELAKRYLLDQGLVHAALIGPSILLTALGAPLMSILPGLLLGMFLLPIAIVLRQQRGDLGALSPVLMVRGIGCCRGYVRVAALYWALFLPATIAFWLSMGHAPWLQLAIVGPLAVVPAFATARLLGTFVDAHKARLGILLQKQGATGRGAAPARAPGVARAAATTQAPARPRAAVPQHTPLQRRPAAPAPAPAPAARPTQTVRPQWAPGPAAQQAPKVPPTRMPKKPEELQRRASETMPAPGGIVRGIQNENWSQQKRSEPRAQKPTTAPKSLGGTAPAGSKPVAPKAPTPKAQAPKTPAARPQPAPQEPARIEGRAPRAAKAPAEAAPQPEPQQPVFTGPDLSGIPGARVISAEDREKMGAASRRQDES